MKTEKNLKIIANIVFKIEVFVKSFLRFVSSEYKHVGFPEIKDNSRFFSDHIANFSRKFELCGILFHIIKLVKH